MRLTEKHIKRLSQLILKELETAKVIEYKSSTQQVLDRVHQIIKADYQREAQLDQDVVRMMDDLERQNPGSFERYKMFPMLKKRLAKERGIIL